MTSSTCARGCHSLLRTYFCALGIKRRYTCVCVCVCVCLCLFGTVTFARVWWWWDTPRWKRKQVRSEGGITRALEREREKAGSARAEDRNSRAYVHNIQYYYSRLFSLSFASRSACPFEYCMRERERIMRARAHSRVTLRARLRRWLLPALDCRHRRFFFFYSGTWDCERQCVRDEVGLLRAIIMNIFERTICCLNSIFQ